MAAGPYTGSDRRGVQQLRDVPVEAELPLCAFLCLTMQAAVEEARGSLPCNVASPHSQEIAG